MRLALAFALACALPVAASAQSMAGICLPYQKDCLHFDAGFISKADAEEMCRSWPPQSADEMLECIHDEQLSAMESVAKCSIGGQTFFVEGADLMLYPANSYLTGANRLECHLIPPG